MSKRFHVMSSVSGLATLAALFVSGSASAARIEGFQARASSAADQPCVTNNWTGIYNTCDRTIEAQIAATVPSSANYTTNGYVYGYNGLTTLQAWAISSTLDFVSTAGARVHLLGTSSAPTWSTFTTSSVSVPSGGALLFSVILAPNQLLSYVTY